MTADAPPATPPDAGPPAVCETIDFCTNPVAADLKYKGRRLLSPAVRVAVVGRDRQGRPYVAPESILDAGGAVAPCLFYYLRSDAAAAAVRPGARYDITGVCRGWARDDAPRGLSGIDGHAVFEDCTLVPAG